MALNRALVVDDSRLARVALSKLLTRRGLEVDVAGSGGEALDHLRHAAPDVVFLDYMMPDMDGFEAARAIQALPECPPLPLVMYTSQDSDSDRARARALGICGFLSKPTSEDRLEGVLREVQAWQPPAEDVSAEHVEDAREAAVTAVPEPDVVDADTAPAEPAEPEPEPEPDPGGELDAADTAPAESGEAPAEEPVRGLYRTVANSARPEPEVDMAALEARAVEAARAAANEAVGRQLDEASIHWQHQLDRMGAELGESLRQELGAGPSLTSDDLEQRLDALREEASAADREAATEATASARTAAQEAVTDAAATLQERAEQAARAAAEQAVDAALARRDEERAGGDDPGERVDALVAQRLEGLADSEVFREQLIASLTDHGIPVLKNALDQWVRERAAEAATAAVDSAVQSASEAMLREAAAAAAEEAAAEAHAAHARTRRFTLAGGLVLAAGVLAALLLAV